MIDDDDDDDKKSKREKGKGVGVGGGEGGESREDRKPEFLSFRSSPFPLSLFNFSAHLTMMVWSLNVFIVIFSL